VNGSDPNGHLAGLDDAAITAIIASPEVAAGISATGPIGLVIGGVAIATIAILPGGPFDPNNGTIVRDKNLSAQEWNEVIERAHSYMRDEGSKLTRSAAFARATDDVRNGYKTFGALKKAWGSVAPDNVLHHIVEQCQANCTRANFDSRLINSKKNVVEVPNAVNKALNAYYSTSTYDFTNGKTVRDWLSNRSFDEQHKFGVKTLRDIMKKFESTGGKSRDWWK
jgi:hypothetical protein